MDLDKFEVYDGLHARARAISRKMVDGKATVPGFEGYTGYRRTIGAGICDEGTVWSNTTKSTEQFVFILAMSRHPLIDEIPERDVTPKELEEAQVLAGIKALDIGCGYLPSYARCSRRLGCDMYTLDKEPIRRFIFSEEFFSDEEVREEMRRHMYANFSSFDAVEKVIERTGGEFDIVTSSFMDHHWWGEPGYTELVYPLLKKGGFYKDDVIIRQHNKVLRKK